jgi:hypothetical protein
MIPFSIGRREFIDGVLLGGGTGGIRWGGRKRAGRIGHLGFWGPYQSRSLEWSDDTMFLFFIFCGFVR